jgi:RNA polymerase primary sigma factor
MAYESEGSLKLYLREISKTPLLTAEEEVELAERIKQGDPEARSHMIRANLRLVVKIAQDYANYGMPVTDLISEGNIGLMKAVERFDPEKGGKLSTYAAWWIKQSIKRALANHSPARPHGRQDRQDAPHRRDSHRGTRPRTDRRRVGR